MKRTLSTLIVLAAFLLPGLFLGCQSASSSKAPATTAKGCCCGPKCDCCGCCSGSCRK